MNLISRSLFLAVLLLVGFQSCLNPGTAKKKVVYVNSYHRGFPPSDQITQGVYETLPVDSFEVISYFMDTKRNPSEAYIKHRVAEILDSILEEDPDVLISSDDNAMKYLVVPNFKEDPLPIVFCGVNWTADQYDLTGINITGILELLPVLESMQTLRTYYPDMQKLLVLNENTTTSRKTRPLLDTLLGGIGLEVNQELVDDFEGWKSVFIEANQIYDVIYLQTRGAIRNWDHEEALKIINEHIKIPLVTCEDFMMPYAVFGLTQVSKEQGIKAAEMAKSILNGKSPSEIPIIKNSMTKVWINPGLAERINFQPEEILMSRAVKVE